MEIAKSYITDEKGSIKSVVIDFETYKRIEEALLDKGLGEAMDSVREDPEVSGEDIKKAFGG